MIQNLDISLFDISETSYKGSLWFRVWGLTDRVAHLDYSGLKYAISHSPIDYLFVTCLDNNPFLNVLSEDKLLDRLQLAETIANRLGVPLCGISVGKFRENKFSMKEIV